MAKGKRSVKPIDYFPAAPRADGRYQKKIRGVFHYFGGPGVSREMALAEYERVRQSLYSPADAPAIEAAPAPGEYAALPLKTCINAYINLRKAEVETGAMKRVSFIDLRACLLSFGLHVGNQRPFSDLAPGVFTSAANHFRSTQSDCRFNHIVSAVNAWLHYADEHDWIAAAPKVGPRWKKVPRSQMARRDRIVSKAEFHALLNAASDQWRAMLMLSLNCGMGPNDLAQLLTTDIIGGVIDNLRPKTGELRIAPLWPETVDAINNWLTLRMSPLPNLFITKYGRAWDAHDVGHKFKDLREAAKVDLGEKVGLYALRHTFSTIADDAESPNGKRLIMGQAFEGMDQVYVNKTRKDPRKLRRIVNVVRKHFMPFPQSDPLAKRVA
jgi:integrase